jgi:hypothetical protein
VQTTISDEVGRELRADPAGVRTAVESLIPPDDVAQGLIAAIESHAGEHLACVRSDGLLTNRADTLIDLRASKQQLVQYRAVQTTCRLPIYAFLEGPNGIAGQRPDGTFDRALIQPPSL